MEIKFTKRANEALGLAKEAAIELGHDFVGTEHILLGLIREKEGLAARVLEESGINEEKLISLIRQLMSEARGVVETFVNDVDYSLKSKNLLKEAHRQSLIYKDIEVGTEHILLAIISNNDNIAANMIRTLGVNLQRLYANLIASMGEEASSIAVEKRNTGSDTNDDNKTTTEVLDKYSRDLTLLAQKGKLDTVVGRENELSRLMQILSRRTKNNPCLIGEPGVGKTAIVEGLALKIANNEVPESLLKKRVVSLDLAAMIAGTKYRGEFEERIKSILEELVAAGNILLFIDEIHTIIGAGGAEGSLDTSNILKPALSRGELQLIGATTIEEYRKHIEKDAALERRFQSIMVEEPSEEESFEILKGLRELYEKHHKLKISDEALKAAVSLSTRYISDRFLPDKAIDLIDEAASRLRLKNFTEPEELNKLKEEIDKLEYKKELAIKEENYEKASEIKKKQEKKKEKLEKLREKWIKEREEYKLSLDEDDVAETVSIQTKIPLKRLSVSESERLMQLEKTLHESVVGQDEAIVAVSKAIRRGRVGLKDPKRPIGSFLFLGPTGVGKTQICKALALAIFGTENALIRVDMSEYMERHTVSKLIGSPPGYVGYDDGGQLSEKVRRNPYSIILFDEIEKAHPDVFNILLQVLDDGHITDSQGRKVNFKNTIIIMTSNAGAINIIEPKQLGFTSASDDKREYNDMKAKVFEELKQMFKPEFLNRIDETIVFHQLSKENMEDIINILLKELNERIKAQINMSLELSDRAKKYIIEKAYDKKYGARPLKRNIQNLLEDKLAEYVLDGTIKAGEAVFVDLKDEESKELVFTRKELVNV